MSILQMFEKGSVEQQAPQLKESLHIKESIMLETIRSRKQLSILCIVAGILALVLGFIVFLFGSGQEARQLIQIWQISITTDGAGATIMGTSIIWGFFAYKIRPQPFIDDYSKSGADSQK